MADRVQKQVKPQVIGPSNQLSQNTFFDSIIPSMRTSKRPPGGLKMADGVWKVVYPQVFGRSRQLSLNKFLDPSIPSMRKVDNGEKRKKREKNGENSGPLTSLPVDRLNGDRLQRRRSCQLQNPKWPAGRPKTGRRGLEWVITLCYCPFQATFAK